VNAKKVLRLKEPVGDANKLLVDLTKKLNLLRTHGVFRKEGWVLMSPPNSPILTGLPSSMYSKDKRKTTEFKRLRFASENNVKIHNLSFLKMLQEYKHLNLNTH
jgi:hypothetical protein